MPEWMTSLFRDEVSSPGAARASTTRTERPASAKRARDGEADGSGADDECVRVAHAAACDVVTCRFGSIPQPRSRPT